MYSLIVFGLFWGLSAAEPSLRGRLADSPIAVFPTQNLSASLRRVDAASGTAVNAVCVDYTAEGYYPERFAELTEGLPPPAGGMSAVDLPATLSVCELEQLHHDCVSRINMYRSGELTFSDGTTDADVVASPRTPLSIHTGGAQCSSHQAMGDLNCKMAQDSGCAHHTSGTCPFGGMRAQNSCGLRGGAHDPAATYDDVKRHMFACLQGMWDEAMSGDDEGNHHAAMKNSDFQYASCGFGWTSDGRVWMNQDFTSAHQSEHCSCEGKSAGSDDGCGGVCTDCTEAEPVECADRPASTGVVSPSCSGDLVGDDGTWRACTCGDQLTVGALGGCGVAAVAEACPISCDACPIPPTTCPSSIIGGEATTTAMATTTTASTAAQAECSYTAFSNTAVRMQGTGGAKLKRASYASDSSYLDACESNCNNDSRCGGFVDDPTDRRGRMCKPKTASSGYPKAQKTFYRKGSGC